MKASVGYRDSVFSLRGLCRVLALVSVSATLTASAAFSDEGGAVSGSQVERQLDEGELDEAVGLFTRLVEAYPEDAHLRIRLGYAYLKRKDFKLATKTFKEAKNLDRTRPEAYVGLGLAHAERPARGLEAFYNFRRAIGEAKRATRLDSTYGPAYRLLGEIYERYEENHKKAIVYFTKYVELESDNPDGLYYFGRACVQAKEYEKIAQYIAPYVKAHPEKSRLLPLVAQAHFFLERFDLALEYFEHYLRTLDEAEHQLYTDVSLVASKKELEDLQATPEAERVAYLEQFWLRRDSDILTKINERIIEHYRRVWFARTFFSDKVHPWDKRGEVYIRYGEPDYRSRSTERQFVQSPEVEAIRNRMAVIMYGAEATFLTFTGPVFPIRSHRDPFAATLYDQEDALVDVLGPVNEEGDLADEFAETTPNLSLPASSDEEAIINKEDSRFDEIGNPKTQLNFGGYAPVTMGNEFGTVPWETWTYTKIGGGIEITFTDEMGSGVFAFAPIPSLDVDPDLRKVSQVTRFAPSTIFENAVAQVPDYYRPGFLHPPLEFYFDLADFRGSDDQTTLEVYYGIPAEQIEVFQKADSTFVEVQCAAALANADHTSVYRTASKHTYRVVDRFTQARGTFQPELLKVQAPPGRYELQVQLKDLTSGRTGIYRQSVEVKAYPEDVLRISDIQLAAAIEDTGSIDRFRKGDIWVVPMPTRNYRGSQKVYFYCEIYNLNRDIFGRTRYSIKYLVRSVSKSTIGFGEAAAARLRSLLRSGKPQVSIAYEQTGSETTVQEYVEIDLTKLKRGAKVFELKIKDLVTGKTATREIRFRYGEG